MNEDYEMSPDQELAMEDAIQERMDERAQERPDVTPVNPVPNSETWVLSRFNANLR